ncbi:putative ribonuclease H-like domain-containing protein [Tanacetum coccineum]
MAFVSSPSSTNEVNTAYGVSTTNSQVSPASTQVSTASTQDSTANLSDVTVYAFLASQPNGSHLIHEDFKQIHEDDLEEMDLKWQLALLSMRTRKEYRGPRNQDSRNWNQDSSRRTVNVEETSSKAMLVIDVAGSQITDKGRKGVGFVSYNVVPPPPTGLFSPPTLDLSNSGLEEFQQPEFEGYGPKSSKTVSEYISNEDHPQKEDRGYVDSGCSMHMTGNMSYLSDFKEFIGGDVTFGVGANSGKITSKGTLKTADESQVLLKVPRKNNMYSVDIKNIIPKESLTCLVAKATLDESMLCHRRLGIRREFSVARTPQQNGVAERRNRTLIEAARTMLDDSKLPTTFWAEAINTALQNRVLVVKPHNKTPYELFRGRTLALSFMRPFGCHVTILNTLDHLVKFDGKSNDRFFVGYSLNSKAFRVYNIITRKVEENLHIRFLEDKPIVVGDGPKWLFDINVLTKSMNYIPVVAGTNSNDSVGTKESVGIGHSSKETGSSQDYILIPLWKDGLLSDSSSKNANNDEPQPSSDAGKKDDEGISQESGLDNQEKPENITLSLFEATHADFFGDELELDISNINTIYPVPSTPNTRINKDHSLDHVIGDVQSSVQIRRMINEQGFISTVYERKTHKDLHNFLFACFLSREEPKKGYTQEEGIDYDEVFAPVTRIEAIRLFLAYALFKDFVVYQIDVKSAFLYDKIEEEVYICQPLGFEDP